MLFYSEHISNLIYFSARVKNCLYVFFRFFQMIILPVTCSSSPSCFLELQKNQHFKTIFFNFFYFETKIALKISLYFSFQISFYLINLAIQLHGWLIWITTASKKVISHENKTWIWISINQKTASKTMIKKSELEIVSTRKQLEINCEINKHLKRNIYIHRDIQMRQCLYSNSINFLVYVLLKLIHSN